MAGASKKTREELLETQFVDRRIPPQHITAEVALDYFMQPENDFFDRTSNNQRVRQQNFNKLDPAKLRAMRGTEYERIFSQGWALHIIQKQCRLGPDRTTPLDAYYMVQGETYKCPDISSVVQYRLTSALHSINKALDTAAEHVSHHPTESYRWRLHDEKEQAVKGDEFTEKLSANPYLSKRKDATKEKQWHLSVDSLIHQVEHELPLPAPAPVTQQTQPQTAEAPKQ